MLLIIIMKPLNWNLIRLILFFALVFLFGERLSALAHASSLGGYPVCEASAAIVVPCPNKTHGCLLVGDNEEVDRMFLYEIQERDNGIQLQARREISLMAMAPPDAKKAFQLEDIEALAKLPDGQILLFGSHSRNKNCKLKGKRRIFAQGQLEPDRMVLGAVAPVKTPKKKHSCDRLFKETDSPGVQAVCSAIRRTEIRAKNAYEFPEKNQREAECNGDPAFNLEGTVAIRGDDGEVRVWVGLRAPLVDGKAILLRQVERRNSFSFDAVALLDLDGLGIRELTLADGRVWGISGTIADSNYLHRLWHFDVAALADGAQIKPIKVADLPNSAEGLVISHGHAIVLMDGNSASKSAPLTCRNDSTYQILRIGE